MNRLRPPSARTLLVLLGAAACALAVLAPGVRAGAEPTLGRSWANGQQGYGTVRPATIYNGGDPTGMVEHVRWSTWGGARARGTGIGDWVWPGESVAGGSTSARATVIAFDLGTCRGKPAYRKISWFFPGYGESFDARTYIDICTGGYGPGVPSTRCAPTALRSPAGHAAHIAVTGASCARARQLVAGSPAVRYLGGEHRFRYAGLYCGTIGGGSPALFECARGPVDILFEVTSS